MPGSVFLYDPDTSLKLGTAASPLVISGTAASGAQPVAGEVASGATDSGNPVKVGGKYNSTLPTFTDGQRADLQLGARGATIVQLQIPGTGNAVDSASASTLNDARSNTVSMYGSFVFGYLFNGTTWDRQRTVTVGDAATTGIPAEGQYLYNGTTWDRQRVGPYQLAQTPITAASGNVANASAAATLAAAASKTTYITGFEITASGATAAAVVSVTVTGTITGTLTYTFVFPAGATVAATPLIVEFALPIPGSAVNTAIVVTCPAGGAGNTNATVVAHGYQQ